MILEHYNAVKALLPSTINVYMWNVQGKLLPDGSREPVKYPYVCLWGDIGNETSGGPDGDSLQDVPDVLALNVRATYAATNGDSLLITVRNVRAALSRKVPVVPGWRPNPLRQSSLMDAQTDTSVTLTGGASPMFAVDEFALVSSKL